jgi:hypothetical protein
MAKEKIEDISTEKLIKRKKFASILIVILIAVAVLDGAAVIYDLIVGDGFEIYLFVPAIACFVIAIPMYMGLKKINEELARRKDN